MRKTVVFVGTIGILVGTHTFAGPVITYGEQSYLQINYYFQIWGQYRSFRYSKDSGSLWDIFFRRNRLNLNGQYNDRISFYFQLDAPFEGQVNKFTGERTRSKVEVLDAYVSIDPIPDSDALHFIIGKFKQTLTRENLEACLEPLNIDRGEVLPYTPFGPSRDTGGAVWGNLFNGKFQYRLMISKGRTESVTPKSSLRFTSRMHVSLLDPETDYGYKGTYLGTKRVLTLGAGFDYQPDVAYANYPAKTEPKNYKGWTVDAFFEYPTPTGVYTLSGAYIRYDVGDAINKNPDPTLPISTQLKGYYIKGGYLYPKKIGFGFLQPFFRYERDNYGLKSGLYSNKQYSLGFNYYINGQSLKVTFQADRVKYDKEDPTNFALQNYTQYTLGFQMLF